MIVRPQLALPLVVVACHLAIPLFGAAKKVRIAKPRAAANFFLRFVTSSLLTLIFVYPYKDTNLIRINLHSRRRKWLEKTASQISKPFGQRIEPLKWNEIISKIGRTQHEIISLKKHLHSIGGNVQGVCQSRLCIFARVSKGSASQDIASFVHDHLHRSLIESSIDQAIVKGVTLITTAEDTWLDTKDYFVRKLLDEEHQFTLEKLTSKTGSSPNSSFLLSDRLLQSDPFPGQTLLQINSYIFGDRAFNQTTLSDLNRFSFYSFPVFCKSTTSSGITQIYLESATQSCPQSVTVTYQAWDITILALGSPQQVTIQTANLPSQTCQSILGHGNCNAESVVSPSLVLEWQSDTLIKTIDWVDYLPSGLTYFIQGIAFSQAGVPTLVYNTYISLGPTITPSYGNSLYNVPAGHQGAGLGVTALFAPGVNAYSAIALKQANTAFGLPTPNITLYTSSLFPGMEISQCTQLNCIESDLDVQMITQYGTGASFGFIPSDQVSGGLVTVYDIFVGYREALIQQNIYPDVLSLSWGSIENDSPSLDDILMTFSTAGITVLAATGDRGAADLAGNQTCNPSDFTAYLQNTPVMSSWVLVGATQQAQLPGLNGAIGPIACMGPSSLAITSTGTIYPSSVIPMPEYQNETVFGYLNSAEFQNSPYPPHATDIPSPGRSIPDVSAFGAFIPIKSTYVNISAPDIFNVAGTSASTPAFAGLLLQVRGALLELPQCANKVIKFGHINPMIYWMAKNRPDAFTDITIGNNFFDGQEGHRFDLTNCKQGFVAAKGWDPVTGVGMMNFPAFVDAAAEYMCTGISTNPPNVSPSPQATPRPTTQQVVPSPPTGMPFTNIPTSFATAVPTPQSTDSVQTQKQFVHRCFKVAQAKCKCTKKAKKCVKRLVKKECTFSASQKLSRKEQKAVVKQFTAKYGNGRHCH